MIDIYFRSNMHKIESKIAFQSQQKEVNKKIERLEERLINEEVSQEIFEKFHKKLKLEKSKIEANLNLPENEASNPEKAIELAIHLATKLNTVWDSSDYFQKQKLQNLVFPEGITYNRKNDECRTIRTNSAFLSTAKLSRPLENCQNENSDIDSEFSCLVAPPGIEPGFKV